MRIELVGVAVEHGVDAVGLGDDRVAPPDGGAPALTEVGEKDHVVGRGVVAGAIHGGLHRADQGVARLVDGEVVDEVAVGVLEVLGAAARLGRGDAHVGDADHVGADGVLDDVVGRKDAGARSVGEVAAGEGEALGLDVLDEGLDAVVEVMVAGGGDVVAGRGHGLGGEGAVAQLVGDAALRDVARVGERDEVCAVELALGGNIVLEGGVAELVAPVCEGAVQVVGGDDDDLAGGGGVGTCGVGCRAAR